MLVVLIGVSTWLQFVVVTDLSGQKLTFNGVWHFGEVFSSRLSLYRVDGRQRVWRHVGEQFAYVNAVDQVAHGGGGVMVWAGVCYGQQTQVHFIDAILNAKRYRNEILRPIVVPFLHDLHLMLQQDNARPVLQGSVHNSWKLKTSQFLHRQNTHRTCHPLSMFGMLWIGVYDSLFQFLPISSNFTQPLKRSGPTFHNQQPDQLYAKEMCCTAWGKWWSHQILTGFLTPWTPQYSKTAHFRVAFNCGSLRHTCAIIMLSNQHLDMPHLWGGWIISAKKKCSLTLIYTDLWTISERNRPFVYIEKVLDLWVQLMKNGGKNKSVAFIIWFSVEETRVDHSLTSHNTPLHDTSEEPHRVMCTAGDKTGRLSLHLHTSRHLIKSHLISKQSVIATACYYKLKSRKVSHGSHT